MSFFAKDGTRTIDLVHFACCVGMPPSFRKMVNEKGISTQQKQEIYEEWSAEYDTDSISAYYSAPKKCSDAICSYITKDRKRTSILDIGAGTGFVGEELYKQGFRIIDAVDPSQAMLNEAKKKDVYREFFCNFITSEPSEFLESNSYDVVTSCGCLNPGHLPYDVIIEMIRITKPGGIVCLSCRTEHVYEAPEYAEFFPLCDQL